MAQLRQDYQQFIDREAEILVVCPENQEAVSRYWQKESLPFVGLADPAHTVADQYDQQVKLLKLGRLPALMVIDKSMNIVYSHYGNSMRNIPDNKPILQILERLNVEVI